MASEGHWTRTIVGVGPAATQHGNAEITQAGAAGHTPTRVGPAPTEHSDAEMTQARCIKRNTERYIWTYTNINKNKKIYFTKQITSPLQQLNTPNDQPR